MLGINREKVLSFFLAFVVIWFGWNEVSSPKSWVIFMPSFLSSFSMVNYLVMGHGILLMLLGASLLFNFHRRVAAFVIAIMLASIVVTLFLASGGLDETVVRDIGLFGMALALSLAN